VGDHGVDTTDDGEALRVFTRGLLRDLEALERMLAAGHVATGPIRFGVEQEMFLVRPDGRAAPDGPDVLARNRARETPDHRLTSELARFNLEANLDPHVLDAGFLDTLRADLDDVLTSVAALGGRPLLTGILPSLRGADLDLSNMTPEPRYRLLNDRLLAHRGGAIEVLVRGRDDLHRRQHDVMLEAANASMQLHLQVAPADFARMYDLAQLISAPLLAACASSPLLFGRRLWRETRVALFELATDERSLAERRRGVRPRVGFGDRWCRADPAALFRDDLARFPILLTRALDEDPLAALDAGRVPKLRALSLHNGTVWRWNRACYGASASDAHLRIENRVLPAGPTVADEVAGAAFFYGLMACPERFENLTQRIDFDDARAGFFAAARHGLGAQLPWLDGRATSAAELVLELAEVAREGLVKIGLSASAAEDAMLPIRARAERRRTPAKWIQDAFETLGGVFTREHASNELVQVLREKQTEGVACHEWPDFEPRPRRGAIVQVREAMTEVPTLRPEDAAELASRILEWTGLPVLAVEDREGVLVGAVDREAAARGGSVAEVLSPDPPVVTPELPLTEARASGEPWLLVVSGDTLVGVLL